MFLGGMGHLMFNYWGFYGKYLPWLLGILSVFFVEKAMISLLYDPSKIFWNKVSLIKLFIVLFLEILAFYFVDMSKDHSIGLTIPVINLGLGFIFSLALLGNKFKKELHKDFVYMIYGFLLLVPSGLLLSFKINFHPWFDKNDFGHLILIIAMLLYFKAIKSYGRIVVDK